MSLFIDIFIIIAAIAAIYSGISRGFVKSVMGFVSLILAIAAAFIFTPQLADFYSEKFVSGWVGGIVETSLDELVTAGGQRLELSKIFEDKPDALISVAERFGIDLEEIESYYLEIQPEDDTAAIKSMSEQIASPTAERAPPMRCRWPRCSSDWGAERAIAHQQRRPYRGSER